MIDKHNDDKCAPVARRVIRTWGQVDCPMRLNVLKAVDTARVVLKMPLIMQWAENLGRNAIAWTNMKGKLLTHNGEERGASRLAGEASASIVVLGAVYP